MTQQALAPSDRQALVQLEAVVKRGMTTFVEVGQALMEIRDRKLFRETHADFPAYCKERWGFTKSYANNIIQGSKVAMALPADLPRPHSEHIARELRRLPVEERDDAWREAVEIAGDEKPTAAKVRGIATRGKVEPLDAVAKKFLAAVRALVRASAELDAFRASGALKRVAEALDSRVISTQLAAVISTAARVTASLEDKS